ncbi:hypothetical protein DFJ74DRAFT_695524 [Hyaloraphidium curvatum]|nr:hypothetical protein DFJ74DRAFT_695524 [Hyaloraphidium curvatum]
MPPRISLVLVLLFCSTLVAGRPAGPATVLFARSCGDCAPEAFCEVGYSGAPDDQVACVQYARGDAHSLYRRYGFNDICTISHANQVCSEADKAENLTLKTSASDCYDFCKASTNGPNLQLLISFSSNEGCLCHGTCSTFINYPGADVYSCTE